MAITLSTPSRNASCNAVTALCNVGGAGKINIRDALNNILCTIVLANPAFGGAVVGVAAALGLPITGVGTVAAGAGTIATKYDVVDTTNANLWSGVIPTDMVLDNPSIAQNQAVAITAWNHTQPA